MIPSYLIRIIEEITNRLNFPRELPNEEELKTLLKDLEGDEKVFIAKKFCSLEWNIGSIRMLGILQNCGIITATKYILKQDDVEHVQLVLNDFLEFEFDLLGNIFTNYQFNLIDLMPLKLILEECLKRLIRDLNVNPNTLKINYLREIKNIILDETLSMIKILHLKILLQENEMNFKEAFSQQYSWKNIIPKETFFWTLLKEISDNKIMIIEELLKKSMETNFKGWKFYTIFLNIIFENPLPEFVLIIKKHLKDLFKRFITLKEEYAIFCMFITARIIFPINITDNNIETYNQWFKNTIGDMKYLINVDEFKDVMKVLNSMITLEDDITFLKIQTTIAISTPKFCNDLVLLYKKQCKQRIGFIENREPSKSSNDLNESIIIEDD